MRIDMLDQLIRIFAHTEEVRFLLGRLYLPAAVGTFAIHQLGFRPEGLAGCTVHSLIGALIDIALIIEALEDLLHLFLMVIVCGPDKLVIGRVHQIPQSLDRTRHIIHKLLRRDTRFLCFQLDLLPVLIRSRLEKDIVTVLSLKTGNAVGQHDLIAVADMRLAGRVGNRRSDIIFSLVLHSLRFLIS